MRKTSQFQNLWRAYDTKIVLAAVLLIFIVSSLFIALRLRSTLTGIIPDESAHFIFSKHFSKTAGIPPDTAETYVWGWYIKQNPFLYYWINARIINLLEWIKPNITDLQLLVALRVVNVLYAFTTVVFCFLLSKQVIQHKWWQLLPVFLLTHTLMFVFLTGGVNYDNLANMLSMISLFYLVKALKGDQFVKDSLKWMIFVAIGTLTKYTLLPLALAMGIAWIAYMVRNRKIIFPAPLKGLKTALLILFLAVLIIGNFAIYGINILRFKSILPPCEEILLESQCELSGFERRLREVGLEKKLTIKESVAEGYPSLLRYLSVDWVEHMLMRTFGMISHEAYFPRDIILFLRLLFYWMALLSIFNLMYYQRLSHITLTLVWITIFYSVVLFIQNYNTELIYGFKQIMLQGRYIFPVIGAIYILFTKVLEHVPFRSLRWATLAFTIGLFLYGGPITILREYNSFLIDWFY